MQLSKQVVVGSWKSVGANGKGGQGVRTGWRQGGRMDASLFISGGGFSGYIKNLSNTFP